MKKYYVSLAGPFYGYYLAVKAKNKKVVKTWVNSRLPSLSQSFIYTQKKVTTQNGFDKTKIIGMKIILSEEDGIIYENGSVIPGATQIEKGKYEM